MGLAAWGADPAQAFAQAAWGMFAIILGADPAGWTGSGAPRAREVSVAGADWPELLVNWLVELLFHFDVDGLVPRRIAMAHCTPPRCAARLEGVCLADPGQAVGVGIKAVTYHQLVVQVAPQRTDLRVIFDI